MEAACQSEAVSLRHSPPTLLLCADLCTPPNLQSGHQNAAKEPVSRKKDVDFGSMLGAFVIRHMKYCAHALNYKRELHNGCPIGLSDAYRLSWLQAAPGKFLARAWPEDDALAPATPEQAGSGKRRTRRSTQRSDSGQTQVLRKDESARQPSWRAQVRELEHNVSLELQRALGSALLLLTDQVSAKQVQSIAGPVMELHLSISPNCTREVT